jgi:membrane protein required for colicin V production
MAIFTPLFASAVQRSALGGVDQGLGFLFGVLRGILLIAVAFVVYDRALAGSGVPVVDTSQSARIFSGVQDRLNEEVPADAPGWIKARYQELVGKCGTPVQTTIEPGTTDGTGAKTVTPPAPAN